MTTSGTRSGTSADWQADAASNLAACANRVGKSCAEGLHKLGMISCLAPACVCAFDLNPSSPSSKHAMGTLLCCSTQCELDEPPAGPCQAVHLAWIAHHAAVHWKSFNPAIHWESMLQFIRGPSFNPAIHWKSMLQSIRPAPGNPSALGWIHLLWSEHISMGLNPSVLHSCMK